ncbi:site-specific integrase [Flagellimonas allohymeniacidonis]|uniref:Site-specific integrase n=1 Tax=Flagellimonas allohymeniacidonis TaxID=2517819 RepID=A0A4Q8QHL7_9FLAO|nr:site-specific integrase [Allomuricauda hymeniacidonis]TAI49277.1 site-specific integrase [Allomuricauda hymeniacidonis]
MRNNSTLKVLIFTRDHTHNPEKLTIYARITVDGKRAEISLKRRTSVNEWDEIRGRVIGFSQKARTLNSYLDEVYIQIMDAHKRLMGEGKVITAQAIKARFLGQDDQNKTLKELIEYHNTTQILVLRPGTMKNYYSTERYLHKFLDEKLKLPDIFLKQLNYRFITDFEQYLRTYQPRKARKTCSNNGAMKHMERLMKMINLAVRLEWLEKDPFRNYKLNFHKTERSYLTERELRLIEQTTFKGVGYEKVKDVFLFSCYTGLSYIDVKELKSQQLVLGIDGNLWIHTKREKTNETVKIPLLPKAKEIIEKYGKDARPDVLGKLLPVYSNQKTNSYLKVITKACGIHKHITFHTARHTFATTITLSNGVPIETVSKMLGHTKLTTTQIYARVLERKVGEDMQRLITKMETKSGTREIRYMES